ncbi:OLC1v1016291C1 [Oldenlandia corymbosa var. corymbosa]|uniref:OLC1v1016291C1 n=1 Tax=Oldenlandia corymbosa var. corymbosa TaxID=529605 RepID=A0AAV1E5M3_OLDCO|nr:OLC1v1016291C1 [Oldenlandia corymbosa var. corymbosa]
MDLEVEIISEDPFIVKGLIPKVVETQIMETLTSQPPKEARVGGSTSGLTAKEKAQVVGNSRLRSNAQGDFVSLRESTQLASPEARVTDALRLDTDAQGEVDSLAQTTQLVVLPNDVLNDFSEMNKTAPVMQANKFAILQSCDDNGDAIADIVQENADEDFDDIENVFTEVIPANQLVLMENTDTKNAANDGQDPKLFYPDDSLAVDLLVSDDDNDAYEESWLEGDKDTRVLAGNAQGELTTKKRRGRKMKDERAKLIAVYAKSNKVERRYLWATLETFRSTHVSQPWVVGGDFNVIRSLDEYSGNSVQDYGAIDEFNQCIEENNLMKIPSVGDDFTWGGTRATSWVSKNLDRILFSSEWMDVFPKVSIELLSFTTSDHSPLLLQFDAQLESKPRSFRFQKMWLQRGEFKDLVQYNLSQPVWGSGMLAFSLKLRRLKLALKEWNKLHFGDVFQNLKLAEDKHQKQQVFLENLNDDLSLEDKHMLVRLVTMEEVRAAVFNLDEDSAPAEAMSRKLNDLVRKNKVAAYGTPAGSMKVSHLSFTGDLIIFTRGEARQLKELNKFLEAYEIASGQRISCNKSFFLVPESCSAFRVEAIKRVLTMTKGSFPFKCLGCNLFCGRSRASQFQFLLDSLDSKIASWKNKFLSSGGRLILLRHVLAAMPIHVLSAISPPPMSVLKEMEKRCQRFLWHGSNDEKRRHWRSWDRLALPISENGLGLHKVEKVDMEALQCSKVLDILAPEVMRSLKYTAETLETGRDSLIWQLSSSENLSKFGIQVLPSICLSCQDHGDSVLHCFLECMASKEICKFFFSLFEISWRDEVNLLAIIQEWWKRGCFSSARKSLIKIAPSFILWEIWKMRNKMLFDGETFSCERVISAIKVDLCNVLVTHEWKAWTLDERDWIESIFGFQLQNVMVYRCISVIRKAPEHSEYVLNTNGSNIHSDSGYGFCIRRNNGGFIYGESGFIGDGDSFGAEVYGVRFGARKCDQLGLQRVAIQTDNESLVHILGDMKHVPWKYHFQLMEIHHIIERQDYTISTHISRSQLSGG